MYLYFSHVRQTYSEERMSQSSRGSDWKYSAVSASLWFRCVGVACSLGSFLGPTAKYSVQANVCEIGCLLCRKAYSRTLAEIGLICAPMALRTACRSIIGCLWYKLVAVQVGPVDSLWETLKLLCWSFSVQKVKVNRAVDAVTNVIMAAWYSAFEFRLFVLLPPQAHSLPCSLGNDAHVQVKHNRSLISFLLPLLFLFVFLFSCTGGHITNMFFRGGNVSNSNVSEWPTLKLMLLVTHCRVA